MDVLIYIPDCYKDFGYKTKGSVGFDICSVEDVEIPPKSFKLVNTGIRIKILKKNIFPMIVPRSSLFIKKNLIMGNSVGIIDLDYCGKDDEIKMILYNVSDEPVQIAKGERIGQIIFINFDKPKIKLTKDLNLFESSRGGFGSTGGYKIEIEEISQKEFDDTSLKVN
jgi:dUTP pyrophosphatase